MDMQAETLVRHTYIVIILSLTDRSRQLSVNNESRNTLGNSPLLFITVLEALSCEPCSGVPWEYL